MNKRTPSCRRAFWTTVAVVGAVNIAFLVYYLSISIREIPEKGHFTKGREVPEWAMSIYIMNAPVYVILCPIAEATRWKPETESQWVFVIVLCHTISTFLWGAFAVLIERLTHFSPRNPQAMLGSG